MPFVILRGTFLHVKVEPETSFFLDDQSGINIVEFFVFITKIGRFNSPMNIEETWSLFRIFG